MSKGGAGSVGLMLRVLLGSQCKQLAMAQLLEDAAEQGPELYMKKVGKRFC